MTEVSEASGKIRVADFDGDDESWDRFVRAQPGATFCHLAGWRRVMNEVLGHECHYRVAVDAGGDLAGVLPLVRVRSLLFGDYLLSMPFLNYGGPLGSETARRRLGEVARESAEAWGVDLLELRSREPVPGDLRTSDRKITVLLDLPDDPEVLWMDGLRSKVRSQVRRPKKEGMVLKVGMDELDSFYRVFSETMLSLGTPVLPRALFEALAELFPDEVVFASVYLEEKPVAAGCGFVFGDEFEITWAGSLREYSRQAPNMLLYWGLMEEMIEREIGTFNFGRCTPGSGTHRFKSQWGGRDVPLPWAQWSPTGRTEPPSPDRPLFKLATNLWSRLPLGVANLLGPFLSRNLP